MWLIFLYPIFWVIVFARIRDKDTHKVYCSIILLFLLSALASCYLVYNTEEYANNPLDFIAISYHLLMMWLLLKSVKSYDNMHYKFIMPVPNKILMPFSIAIILIMLSYISLNISQVNINALLTDAQSLRSVLYEEQHVSSYIRYINYLGETYSVIPLALMFYFMCYAPNRKVLIYVLFICSLGQAIISLSAAGREYILKYIFVFSILFYLVGNNLSRIWFKRLKIILLIILIGFGAIFLLITYMRFTYTRDISSTQTILSYLGQGNVYFSERFLTFPDGIYPEKGQRTFPLIFGNSNYGSYNLNDIIVTDVRLNVFATGIGTWLGDAGIFLTFIFTLFFSFIYKKIGDINNYNVFTIIYFALVFEQVFSLLFFFHGSWNGTRVLSILIIILLDLFSRRKIIIK